jgi:hypothetical protein
MILHPCPKCGLERHPEWRPHRMQPTYRCWPCIRKAKRGNGPSKPNRHYARGRRKDCAICGSTELAVINPSNGSSYTDCYCRPCRQWKTKQSSLRRVERNELLAHGAVEHQVCKVCSPDKPLPASRFNIERRRKTGLDALCKLCRSKVRSGSYKRFLKAYNEQQTTARV